MLYTRVRTFRIIKKNEVKLSIIKVLIIINKYFIITLCHIVNKTFNKELNVETHE